MSAAIETTAPAPAKPKSLIEGVTLTGGMNVSHDLVRSNILHSIHLGYPQLWQQAPRGEQVCIVGGGPSLAATEAELVQLAYEGALVVTVNGAYQWCLDRHIRPNAQIVMDARPSNARFVNPVCPGTRYYLASQAHPDTWAAVAGRPHVAIFHAVSRGDEDEVGLAELNAYYLGQWQTCSGGTTAGSRAIGLCRMLGYLRYHLFGFDCCYLDGAGHAYPQPENDADQTTRVSFYPSAHPDLARAFTMTPWHIKQLDELLMFMRDIGGHHFVWNVHGDGALAFALSSNAQPSVNKE